MAKKSNASLERLAIQGAGRSCESKNWMLVKHCRDDQLQNAFLATSWHPALLGLSAQ